MTVWIGTLLGGEGIGIQAAGLSPNTEDGTATLVLRVDATLSDDQLSKLKDELDAQIAFQLAF